MTQPNDVAPATLSEVAAEAKLAVSTVSRALRALPNVSDATRQRVLAAAERVGYRPNAYINALMASLRNKSPLPFHASVAWLDISEKPDEWKSHPFQMEVFSGATARAQELGFTIDRVWAGDGDFKANRISSILVARGITGVLFASGSALSNHPTPAEIPLDLNRFAVVSLGMRVPSLDFSMLDHFDAGRSAALAMLALGYRRLGFISGTWLEELVQWRFFAGFHSVCHETPDLLVNPLLLKSQDLPSLKSWLRQERPDAVVASVHQEVFDLLRVASAATGHKIAYACLNADACPPEIAGIVQQNHAVGANAVDFLANRVLRNDIGFPRQTRGILVEGLWRDAPSAPPQKPK